MKQELISHPFFYSDKHKIHKKELKSVYVMWKIAVATI